MLIYMADNDLQLFFTKCSLKFLLDMTKSALLSSVPNENAWEKEPELSPTASQLPNRNVYIGLTTNLTYQNFVN